MPPSAETAADVARTSGKDTSMKSGAVGTLAAGLESVENVGRPFALMSIAVTVAMTPQMRMSAVKNAAALPPASGRFRFGGDIAIDTGESASPRTTSKPAGAGKIVKGGDCKKGRVGAARRAAIRPKTAGEGEAVPAADEDVDGDGLNVAKLVAVEENDDVVELVAVDENDGLIDAAAETEEAGDADNVGDGDEEAVGVVDADVMIVFDPLVVEYDVGVAVLNVEGDNDQLVVAEGEDDAENVAAADAEIVAARVSVEESVGLWPVLAEIETVNATDDDEDATALRVLASEDVGLRVADKDAVIDGKIDADVNGNSAIDRIRWFSVVYNVFIPSKVMYDGALNVAAVPVPSA